MTRLPRLIHYHYTRPGKSVATYDHWLIHDTADLQVLFMPSYASVEVRYEGELAIDDGGAMLWFLFPGKWWDIGSFYLADGTHTGWYTNFCTPARVEGDRWYARDLFLDHWTAAAGQRIWLDEDEYADAVARELITETERQMVDAGRTELLDEMTLGWPPPSILGFDLARARTSIDC